MRMFPVQAAGIFKKNRHFMAKGGRRGSLSGKAFKNFEGIAGAVIKIAVSAVLTGLPRLAGGRPCRLAAGGRIQITQ